MKKRESSVEPIAVVAAAAAVAGVANSRVQVSVCLSFLLQSSGTNDSTNRHTLTHSLTHTNTLTNTLSVKVSEVGKKYGSLVFFSFSVSSRQQTDIYSLFFFCFTSLLIAATGN